MLVLSRKKGQRIVIDGDIEVRVQRVSRGRVSLSIKAPPEVSIVRGELLERDSAGWEAGHALTKEFAK